MCSDCVLLNPSNPQKSGLDMLKYILTIFKTIIKKQHNLATVSVT